MSPGSNLRIPWYESEFEEEGRGFEKSSVFGNRRGGHRECDLSCYFEELYTVV